jgi:chromate transport protein ChrA
MGVSSNLVSAAILWLLALAFDLVRQQVWLTSLAGLVLGVATVVVLPARTSRGLASMWVLIGLAAALVITGVALVLDGWVRASLLILATLVFLYWAAGAWVAGSGTLSPSKDNSTP